MKRSTNVATVAESQESIRRFLEFLADPKWSHFHMYQFHRYVKGENLSELAPQWLKSISSKHIAWEKAGNAWYNKPEWPFQIAKLNYYLGWNERLLEQLPSRYDEDLCEKIKRFDIETLYRAKERPEETHYLIRIELGWVFPFLKNHLTIDDFSKTPFPSWLRPCSNVVPFHQYSLGKEYDEAEDVKTYVITEKLLDTTVKEKALYSFGRKRKSNDLEMNLWEVKEHTYIPRNAWCVFEYNF